MIELMISLIALEILGSLSFLAWSTHEPMFGYTLCGVCVALPALAAFVLTRKD